MKAKAKWLKIEKQYELCPKHGVRGMLRIKEINGHRYAYIHHYYYLAKHTLDCYAGKYINEVKA